MSKVSTSASFAERLYAKLALKAAAATAVGMVRCTAVMRPNPPKNFRADHPFLFFIRNTRTGTVYFQGRVLDL
jgi:serpin B